MNKLLGILAVLIVVSFFVISRYDAYLDAIPSGTIPSGIKQENVQIDSIIHNIDSIILTKEPVIVEKQVIVEKPVIIEKKIESFKVDTVDSNKVIIIKEFNIKKNLF